MQTDFAANTKHTDKSLYIITDAVIMAKQIKEPSRDPKQITERVPYQNTAV